MGNWSQREQELLTKLCTTPGVSGYEELIRDVMRTELTPLVDSIAVDAMGNLIGTRRGNGGPRVLVAAHLDEIGFIVRHVDANGFLRLQAIGGFDPSRLPAQRVHVHGRDGRVYYGSINVAGKPIHLRKGEEIGVKIEELFVDIGLSGEAAKEAIEIGDMVTLERGFHIDDGQIMTKALDDRVGLFILLEALRRLPAEAKVEVIAVATVQEEVGVRGAATVAFAQEPAVAIAIDITPAGDFPDAPEEFVGVKLGGGVALKVMDTGAISDRKLNRKLRDIADARGIPYQLEILARGGTDAGGMQRTRGGVPVTALSVPVRYAHTVNETCSTADIDATIDLLVAWLESL